MNFKQELEIYLRKDEAEIDGFDLVVIPTHLRWSKYSDDILITTKEVEFEVEMPSKDDLIQKAIGTFQTEIQDIYVEAERKVQKLRTKIEELQQLTYIEG